MKAASDESRLIGEDEKVGKSGCALAPGDLVGVVLLCRAARSAEVESMSNVTSSSSDRSAIDPNVLLPGTGWLGVVGPACLTLSRNDIVDAINSGVDGVSICDRWANWDGGESWTEEDEGECVRPVPSDWSMPDSSSKLSSACEPAVCESGDVREAANICELCDTSGEGAGEISRMLSRLEG